MTLSFKDLKRSSNSDFEKLNQEISKLNAPAGRQADDRIWSCKTDKAGNGNAIIRFLPAPANEDVPFVRLFTHGFKGPGGWYIENCLSTIGQYDDDPVNQWNTELWNSGIDANKKIVQGSGKDNPGTKRQLSYYSNIYVVKDPANPENEGKVFLFKYGKKIFDKLSEMMNPAEDPLDPKDPVNPFDLWTGANFKLKIRRVDGYANFDSSSFDTPGPLLPSDEALEAVWNAEYSLAELVSADKFKSYDELKKKLDRVRGVGTPAGARQAAAQKASTPPWDDEPAASEPTFRERMATSAPAADNVASEDDDEFGFFKQLAEDD